MSIDISDLKMELGGISDPDLNYRLDEIDALKEVRINGKVIEVFVELTQPIHWIAERVNNSIADLLQKLAPDYESEVNFLEKPQNYKDREYLNGVKNLIAVSSGKGGVGKSSVAANIAVTLAKTGASVGLLDADIYGPSQPTIFGMADKQLVADELPDGTVTAEPLIKYGVKVASMGFVMDRDKAAIIRGPLLARYFQLLLEQVNWGPLDFLIFDLPPGTGDIQLTLTQKVPLTGALIVTTPQEVALADVKRSIAMFNKVEVKVLGVVENMSYFVPPDMPEKKYYIFGEGGGKKVAEDCNIKFLGEIPIDMNFCKGNDKGKPALVNDKGLITDKFVKLTEDIVTQVRFANFSKLEFDPIELTKSE